MEGIKELISNYENFPEKGINFKDVLEILQDPLIFKELIREMATSEIIQQAEAVVSIDARGFIFGSAICLQSSKPMIVARKPGKLPGELITKTYNLEYGSNSLSIQKKALERYNSFAIVDDLLATGGTVGCVSNILNNNNKVVTGLLIVAELIELKGRFKLKLPVESFIKL